MSNDAVISNGQAISNGAVIGKAQVMSDTRLLENSWRPQHVSAKASEQPGWQSHAAANASPTTLRVLFYNHTSHVSGAERVLLQTLEAIRSSALSEEAEDSYEVLVACPPANSERHSDLLPSLPQLLSAAGFACVPVPSLNARFTSDPRSLLLYLRSLTSVIFSFRKTVRMLRPDVLHANSIRAAIVATLATLGMRTPVLWHIHDELPRHPLSSAIRLLFRFSPRSHALAVSHATARAFSHGTALARSRRIEVLSNGIDCNSFPHRDSVPAAPGIREELGLSQATPLIASIGLIHPRKGLLELVDAFASASPQLPGAHLLLVGAAIFNRDDLYRDLLIRRIASYDLQDRIHLTGPRSDVPVILRTIDLLVHNASVEPFGLVLLEAMCSGAPVLAAAVGGIPEIVTDNVHGFLLPCSATRPNTAALADRLVEIMQAPELRAQVAASAYASVSARFSLGQFERNLQDFYQVKFAVSRPFTSTPPKRSHAATL